MHLIILTKKWGRNFTGATLATQYFAEKWISGFESINVFTLNIGDSVLNDFVNVVRCKNELELKRKINRFLSQSVGKTVIGYSDDHLGYLLKLCKVKYIHTYHGNWPDARKINLDYFLKSFYFIPCYKKTIKKANGIVNVSEYMKGFTDLYNQNTITIRNGMDIKICNKNDEKKSGLLMVGNVDRRKYKLCLGLCQCLRDIGADVSIDVYGRVDDIKLKREMEKYPNIHLLGLQSTIPYKKYVGMINTSCIENLSISVCESLANSVPVVCFDVGGLSEVVHNGVNGFVIAKFDVRDMAEKVLLLHNGYELPDCCFEQISEFDWERSAEKYMTFFKEVSYENMHTWSN